jgi:hypothetical protein
MGYYTDFYIEKASGEVAQAIKDISGYEWPRNDDCLLEVKWYDFHEHMNKILERFPNETFIILGEGEERGHVWKLFAKNGKGQTVHGRVVFDAPEWFGEEK